VTFPLGCPQGGRSLWESLLAQDATLSDDLNPARQMALEACRTKDRLDALDEICRTEPVMLDNGKGQPVAHPAWVEARQQGNALKQMIVALRLPDTATRSPAAGAARLRRRRGVPARPAAASSPSADALAAPGGRRLPFSLGWQLADWIEAYCCHGPGDIQGEPIELDDEWLRFLVHAYRIDPETGRRIYDEGVLSRPKGRAKSELAGFVGIAEAFGPVRFDGWDADGQPVGRRLRLHCSSASPPKNRRRATRSRTSPSSPRTGVRTCTPRSTAA
jgi:hypothetical protein